MAIDDTLWLGVGIRVHELCHAFEVYVTALKLPFVLLLQSTVPTKRMMTRLFEEGPGYRPGAWSRFQALQHIRIGELEWREVPDRLFASTRLSRR